MRPITIAGVLLALPLVTVVPASAQNNWTDQAQRLLNPNGGRNAYERGRQDQAQQEQWQRDQRRAERYREHDARYSNGPNERYYDPNYR